MSKDLECRISVKLLLEVAQRLSSYDKTPLAEALIYVVLEQYPEHPIARRSYETITGKPMPTYPVSRSNRIYRDSETGMFIVENKSSRTKISFETLEAAQEYLRGLK